MRLSAIIGLSQIIHHKLGRGHSKLPGGIRQCSGEDKVKDKYLQNIYHMVSTNMGLMQANMT